jgi:protein-S-isoprenylcysteine O-methyltransferase Ste14
MGALELKVPPPLVALLFGVVMWLASRWVAPVDVPFRLRLGVAVAVACTGAAFGISAMVSFARAKTTMNPFKPGETSRLVTGGVFRFTRNPMYLSLLLYLLAWALYLSNWLALVFLPLFVLYIHGFQIAPEERVLASLFGSAYAEYKARVRRWL